MEFAMLISYILGMSTSFKILDILIKKTKTETNTNKKAAMYFWQVCLGIIGCYFFYKMGITAYGWKSN